MTTAYPTSTFLDWLADRLVGVYEEPDSVDFVQRLRVEAATARLREEQLSAVEETYELRKTDSVFITGETGYLLHRVGKPGAIGSELRLSPQQAADLSLIFGLAEHEKHHGIHHHGEASS